MAKDDGVGGDARVQVDDESELAKKVGPAEDPNTKEGVLMDKDEYFPMKGRGHT